jgi:hypothetical protein
MGGSRDVQSIEHAATKVFDIITFQYFIIYWNKTIKIPQKNTKLRKISTI